MKKVLFLAFSFFLIGLNASAQEDKSKRVSPPAIVSQRINSGNEITIDYSQPSVKGRAIGIDVAPFGKIWRTGANEATTFEISKNAKIEGKKLPAGKYSLYTIPGTDEWTIIFNKSWQQWGTVYKEEKDALRVKVKPAVSNDFVEKMTFQISNKGLVSLLWGNKVINFRVK